MSELGASIGSLLPGREHGEVELVGTVVNATVITAVGIILARLAKSQFDEVKRRLDDHDGRLTSIEGTLRAHDARFDAIDARMESFERSLDAMRSDLTRVALAVGAGPAAEAGGNR